MNKSLITLITLISLITFSSYGQIIKPIENDYRAKIVAAIYRIEGGEHTKYPYGVRSIETNGNVERARTICAQTVSNQYIRWQKWGMTNDFRISLADRYCPKSCDKQGNLNWRRNIIKLVK